MRQQLACAAILLAGGASCQGTPADLASTRAHLIDGTDDRLEYSATQGVLRDLAFVTTQIFSSERTTCGGTGGSRGSGGVGGSDGTGGSCVLFARPWIATTSSSSGGVSGGGGNGGESPSSSTRLCDDVRFRNQPTMNGCSGVLVGPRIIATSQSCLNIGNCGFSSVVFSYTDAIGSGSSLYVSPSTVFNCVRATPATASGWVLATLDRDVPRASWTATPPDDPIDAPIDVGMIGYPFGLPEKISPAGRLTSAGLFIDASTGSQGGPVVNTATGQVLGVLAQPPPPDFTASTDSEGVCQREKVAAPQSVPLQLARAIPNAAPVLLTPELIMASLP